MKRSVLLGVLGTVILAGCYGSMNLARNDADTVLSRQLLTAPNPALPGSFPVKRMFYGSGTDKNRAEFRDSTIRRNTHRARLVCRCCRAWGLKAASRPRAC